MTTRELTSKVAIVTGATSGIGAATASRFAAAGAAVMMTGRNPEAAERVAAGITGAGGTAATMLGDIGDAEFCDQLVGQTVERFGRLDIVANIAGVNHRASAAETSNEDWAWVMRTNVDAVFQLSRAAVAAMTGAGHGGAIINLGSTVGSVGTPGMTAYCVSKGAVHQLTRAMALDHADHGIRVNAVAPGAVDTPMLAAGHAEGVTMDQVFANNLASIPQGRIPGPGEIAELITFLASDASTHITGTIIPIDGGYTAQ